MSRTISIHRLDEAKSAAADCVHFGFCTAVCPTYVLDGEENDSPRGRIALAKRMFESGAAPTPETVLHLDRCLSCLSCQSTCAADVDYRSIIDAAREYIERSGVRPWRQRLWRALLARLLTSPRLLAPAMAAGRVLGPLAVRLPGSLGALAQLAAAPGARALMRDDGAAAPSERSSVVPTGAVSAARRVMLLSGCVQGVAGAQINAATIRLLTRAGLEVTASAPTQCCGALELHMGRREQAVRHVAELVEDWAQQLTDGRIDAIVTTTSGCASVMQHYDEMLSDRPQMAERIARVKAASRDITEIAASLDLADAGSARGLRAAYHDACSMKHGLKLTGAPRAAMRRLGIEVLDIAESSLCCGSAGTYNILQPAIAERLGRRKAEHASAAAPDVIAAGNLGCLVQISRFTGIPVAHTVQLLDWASGGPAPEGLGKFQPRPAEPTMSAVRETSTAGVPAASAAPAGGGAAQSEDTFW